jgi:hypothetical protein
LIVRKLRSRFTKPDFPFARLEFYKSIKKTLYSKWPYRGIIKKSLNSKIKKNGF